MMKLIAKYLRDDRGMTLIELMISVFVMSLVLGGSLYMLHQANELSKDSRDRLLAIHAARSTLEAIKNTGLSNVTSISTSGYVPAGLKSGTVAITTNPALITSSTTLATVTVTVNWIGARGRARSLEMTTMRSRF